MARTTAGKRLQRHREASGLRLDDASYRVRELLGSVLGCSRETIRRYEAGLVPEEKWDPLTISALADIYGTSIADLSPCASEAIKSARELLIRLSACMIAQAGQDDLSRVA